MKNQYVADVNDYVKYSILRAVQKTLTDPLFVCWMLTGNDGGTDGRRTSYVHDPSRYRAVDPDLFDVLRSMVRAGRRSTRAIEQSEILPGATFFRHRLTDAPEQRARYMRTLWRRAEGSGVVFFDPDNGLDTQSVPRGRSGSDRYLYCDELAPLHRLGAAAIIYQHFPRVDRKIHVARQLERMGRAVPGFATFAVHSPSVAFLVASPASRSQSLQVALGQVAQRWDGRLVLTAPEHALELEP